MHSHVGHICNSVGDVKAWLCSFFTPNCSHPNLGVSLYTRIFISEFPVFVKLFSKLPASRSWYHWLLYPPPPTLSPRNPQVSDPVDSPSGTPLEYVPSFPPLVLLLEDPAHCDNPLSDAVPAARASLVLLFLHAAAWLALLRCHLD